jgi:hypothetical protein
MKMSSSKSLKESQSQQLSSIRDLFRGKHLLSVGETNWSVEARQPPKQDYLLQQQHLAKRLRQQLEHTNDQINAMTSSKEIRNLILQQTRFTNQLIALTEAIRGNYVLDDYDEYNTILDEQQKKREVALNNAKKTLKNHMRQMAHPEVQWPLLTQVEGPQTPRKAPTNNYHVNNIAAAADADKSSHRLKDPLGQASVSNVIDLDSSIHYSGPTAGKQNTKKPPPSGPTAESQNTKNPQHSGPTAEKQKTKKSQPVLESGATGDGINHGLLVPRQPVRSDDASANLKNPKVPSRKRKQPLSTVTDEVSSYMPSEVPSSTPLPTHHVHKQKSQPLPKKCHSCKSKSLDVLKCRYILPTGTKCGKYYCQDCLLRDYKDSDIVELHPKNLREWQYVSFLCNAWAYCSSYLTLAFYVIL